MKKRWNPSLCSAAGLACGNQSLFRPVTKITTPWIASFLKVFAGTRIFGLALAFLAARACSQDQTDAFMGDWQGYVSVGSKTQTVAAYLIPLAEGKYEARLVDSFRARGPYLYQLRGTITGQEFRFSDRLPADHNSITSNPAASVGNGATRWSGTVTGATVTGVLTGPQTGSFELHKTQRISPELGRRPPEGAVILFDGSNLDHWRERSSNKPIKWKLHPEGWLEVAGSDDIVSKEAFGDHQLHLEFRLPYMPRAFGQDRANSGVYVQGHYEVQVLDSYGLEGRDNECGGFYQIKPPSVNMCAPPLQWQSYDIVFHNAQCDQTGKKTANARITVIHNGTVIHDNFELPHVTPGALDDHEGKPEGLMLQDHGNPVQFRNIWVKRL